MPTEELLPFKRVEYAVSSEISKLVQKLIDSAECEETTSPGGHKRTKCEFTMGTGELKDIIETELALRKYLEMLERTTSA